MIKKLTDMIKNDINIFVVYKNKSSNQVSLIIMGNSNDSKSFLQKG